MVTWVCEQNKRSVTVMNGRPQPVDARAGPWVIWQPTEAGGTGWRCEVVLEMWIDIEQEPIAMRIAGTLDGTTECNVLSAVGEQLAHGARNFRLQCSQLKLADFGGLEPLVALERLVACAGGQLTGAVQG
jgi:ABC-type transporter Mla MlaB component